ncbi:hypothetical protein C0991_003313 [Blastosporella zonata]|nr:hypothetical protein C0991_003313 [Blastosporella zonata]
MLIIFFNNTEDLLRDHAVRHANLEALKLTPVTKADVFDILLNPFSKFAEVVLTYAMSEIGTRDDGKQGMPAAEVRKLIADLIGRSLEVSCRGKLLNELKNCWPSDVVNDALKKGIEKHSIGIEDLPSSDDFAACLTFRAKLSQDHTRLLPLAGEQGHLMKLGDVQGCSEPMAEGEDTIADDIGGHISQETLTSMIRNDELMPVRPRRRNIYHGFIPAHLSGKLPYPSDVLPVAQWIRKTFGHRSPFTAVFMTHAVINDSENILDYYLPRPDSIRHTHSRSCERVPVTLKHFKLLAHLGKMPNFRLYLDVQANCEFYLDETDYLEQDAKGSSETKSVKAEASEFPSSSPRLKREIIPSTSNTRRRKRPRRSATAVRSYAIPDSDDDAIVEDDEVLKKPKLVESNLQKWILHLGEILKDEERKHKEVKRKHNALLEPGAKSRVYKSDFYKSLSLNLRELQKVEDAKQIALHGHLNTEEAYTSDDDDEDYLQTRTKRRKTTRNS